MGAGGMAAAFILASNMVIAAAPAPIAYARRAPSTRGDVEVTAADDAAIDATPRCRPRSRRRTTLGAGILNRFVGASSTTTQFTSHSGTRLVAFGDRVRTDDGTVYQYMGTDATLDLDERRTTPTYGYWKPLEPSPT